jgi:hypothetical protein
MTSALQSSLIFVIALATQAPTGGETTRDVNVQRLELMKESIKRPVQAAASLSGIMPWPR